jgi:hypothetical protein
MPSTYLTKSDFKACLDCRTKLFYRKNRYASTLDDDEYLQFLADGGFMVEFIAKAHFPEGIDLAEERDPAKAYARTKALIGGGDVTIFEAAATAGKLHARTDILCRVGKVLHLIEVKSSSLGDEEDDGSPFLTKKGEIAAKWYPYLIDVAFQTHVLRLAFPGLEVQPQLCVIDKTYRVTAAETLARFSLMRDARNPRSRLTVTYSGDQAELVKSKVVCFRSVTQEVRMLMPEVVAKTEDLAKLIAPDGTVARVSEDIAEKYKCCRECEYRLRNDQHDGFHECWSQLADVTLHILDLHRVGQIGSAKVTDPVPALLKRGRASLLDLEETDLGTEGAFQQRRLMQWNSMRAGGMEHLPKALQRELATHQRNPGWPLHFVDFEACDIALPHHAGLHPYERVAFQWSCHTVHRDKSLTHAEWLNTQRDFPNFAFAQSLRTQIKDEGTVYVWSPYEQSTLNRVLIQIGDWIHRNCQEAVRVSGLSSRNALMDLARWIEQLLGPEDANGKRQNSARIRDLHSLALKHYFHPRMAGRTSIKVVLPAVWESDAALRNHPWFKEYLKLDAGGAPIDPYKTLSPLPISDGEDDVIREGSGAIRVYQDMIFANGTDRDSESRRKLLLQYCQLDTAAMVMIWTHWVENGASSEPV